MGRVTKLHGTHRGQRETGRLHGSDGGLAVRLGKGCIVDWPRLTVPPERDPTADARERIPTGPEPGLMDDEPDGIPSTTQRGFFGGPPHCAHSDTECHPSHLPR